MMLSTSQNKKAPAIRGKWLAAGLAAVFWLAVWQLLASFVRQSVILSPPLEVFGVLLKLMGKSSFWLTVGMSFLRIIGGYAAGVLLGVILTLLTQKSWLAAVLIRPLMSVLKATPVASFIILLLFFAANSAIPVMITAIMVCPLIWANCVKGLEETDRELLEMAQVFALSKRWQRKEIYLPSLLKFFLPAAVTAMGLAWKAGIAAEVLAAPPLSVGGMLYRAKIYLETPEMLAWTLCVILISMCLERLLALFFKRIEARGRRLA